VIRMRFVTGAILALGIAVNASAQSVPPSAVAGTPPSELRADSKHPGICGPFYPSLPALAGVQGTTLLLVRIAADGAMKDPEIIQSSRDSDLDEAALACISHVPRSEPLLHDGKPIEVSGVVRVVWQLHGPSFWQFAPAAGAANSCAGSYPAFALSKHIGGTTRLSYHVAGDGSVEGSSCDAIERQPGSRPGIARVRCGVPLLAGNAWRKARGARPHDRCGLESGAAIEKPRYLAATVWLRVVSCLSISNRRISIRSSRPVGRRRLRPGADADAGPSPGQHRLYELIESLSMEAQDELLALMWTGGPKNQSSFEENLELVQKTVEDNHAFHLAEQCAHLPTYLAEDEEGEPAISGAPLTRV